jgi:RNA polymerase sigma-70 factor (ECF subfamily)
MDISKELQDFRETLNNPADLKFFEKFILSHFELIFDSTLRLSKNQVAGKKLAQKTFLYAIKNSAQLKDKSKTLDWLFSILRTLFLADRTRKKFQNETNFDCINIGKGKRLEKNIISMLNKLDEKLKEPIEMFYREKLSYQEISEALHLPVGTVISRIAKGRVHLSKFLSAD